MDVLCSLDGDNNPSDCWKRCSPRNVQFRCAKQVSSQRVAFHRRDSKMFQVSFLELGSIPDLSWSAAISVGLGLRKNRFHLDMGYRTKVRAMQSRKFLHGIIPVCYVHAPDNMPFWKWEYLGAVYTCHKLTFLLLIKTFQRVFLAVKQMCHWM